MQDKVFERFEVQLEDSQNDIINIQKFDSKEEAIKCYKKYRRLYDDRFVISLIYTKAYVCNLNE